MNRTTLAATLVATLAAASAAAAPGALVGADLSSLPRVEAAGAVFHDGARPRDALSLLASHGFGAVRVRVWVDPADSSCGLDEAVALARRAHEQRMAVLVDLHYSDTWADPGRQDKPRRWASVHGRALEDSVRRWTRHAMRAMRAAGVEPLAVQIGNEVTNGMLWPNGQLVSGGEPSQWKRFAGLLGAAARGVREGAPKARVLVHVDRGGDARTVERFFARLHAEKVAYDDIALSYYPWWHGTLDDLAATLEACSGSLHRDVWLVETAYPWTTGWFDDTRNLVGHGARLLPEFPASPEGQLAYWRELLALARRWPRVRGVFWWEPADVPAPRRGSVWENCALFDDRGGLLPAGRATGER